MRRSLFRTFVLFTILLTVISLGAASYFLQTTREYVGLTLTNEQLGRLNQATFAMGYFAEQSRRDPIVADNDLSALLDQAEQQAQSAVDSLVSNAAYGDAFNTASRTARQDVARLRNTIERYRTMDELDPALDETDEQIEAALLTLSGDIAAMQRLLSQRQAALNARNTLLPPLLLLGVLLLLAGTFGWFLSVLRRVQEIELGAIALGEGRLETRLPQRGQDELSAITSAFNTMAERQARRVRELTEAQAALTGERDLLQSLMDTVPDTIYFKDRESRFTRINRAQSQVLGLAAPEAALGKSDADFMAPALAAQFRHEEAALMESGEPIVDREEFNPLPDGQARWFSATKVPLRDAHGQVVGLIGISRDITERKRSSEQQAYTSKLRVAAEIADQVNTLLEPERLQRRVVSLLQEQFGFHYVHLYLLDETGERLVIAAGSGETGAALEAARFSLPMIQPRSLIVRAAREQRAVRVNNVQQEPIFLPHPLLPDTRAEIAVPLLTQGRVLGVLDVQDDEEGRFNQADEAILSTLAAQIATALENARLFEQAERERALLDGIMQSLPAGVVVTDMMGTPLLVNEVVHRVPAATQGTPFRNSRGEPYPFELLPLAQTLRDGQPHEADDLVARTTSGEPLFLLASATPLRDSSGTMVGAVSIFSDISALKAAEAALRDGEARLRTIVETVPIPIAITSLADASLLFANASAAQTFNLALDQAIGQPAPNFYASPEERAAMLEQLRGRGFLDGYEIEMKRGDGSTFWVAASARPIRFEGQPALLTAMFDLTAIREASDETHRQRAFLYKVIDSNPSLIFAKDGAGRIRLVNHAAALAYGVTPAELVGQSNTEFQATIAQQPDFHEQDTALLASGQDFFAPEVPMADRDGETRWMQLFKRPLTAPDGTKLVLTVATDITERIEAERAVRSSEARNRALVNAVPDLLFRLSRAGIFLDYAAPREVKLYMPPEQFLGRSLIEVMPDSVSGPMMALIQSTLESGQPQVLSYQLPLPDGELMDYEARYVVSGDDDVLVIVRDVTEMRRAQERVRASEARFRSLTENASDVVTILDASGVILYESPPIQPILGYDPEELLGTNALDHLHPEDVEPTIAALRQLVMEPTLTISTQFRFRHKDGAWRTLEAIGQNRLDDPTISGLIVNSRDITERNEAAETIRRSQEQLAKAQQIAHLGSWQWDLLTGEIVWSDELCRLTGIEPGSFAGTTAAFFETIHPDDVDFVRATAQQAYATGTPFEYRTRWPDGSERTLLAQGEIHFDDDGTALLMRGTAQDITERKRAEAERERFTRQLRTAAELVEQLASILDRELLLERTVSLLQERFDLYHAHIYLLDEEQQQLTMRFGSGRVGQTLRESGHAIPLSQRQSLVARAARQQQLVVVDDVQADPDFLPNPHLPETRSEVAVPLATGGRVLGVLDVQDNQPGRFNQSDLDTFSVLAGEIAAALENARLFEEVERNLAETQTRFAVSQALAQANTEEQVLDAAMGQAGFYAEAQVSFLMCQEGEENGDELVVRRSADFQSGIAPLPEGRRFAIATFPLIRHMDGREPFVSLNLQEDERLRGDRTIHQLVQELGIHSASIFPIRYGEEMWGFLVVATRSADFFTQPQQRYLYQSLAEQAAVALRAARLFDETQRTAEELRELDRLKSEFLANMSHELRTPLNSIIGYAEIMLMGINGELNSEMEEDVRAIHSSGQNLLRLINDILDLAKIEAGRMTLEMEPVAIAAVLDEVQTHNLSLLRKKPVQLVVEQQAGLPLLVADRLRLNQILTNLLSNAIKFTDSGTVWLRAAQQGEQLVLEVEDTGIGMRPDDLSTIFEEFRQVDGSSTRRAEGTGLGLAITSSLVALHGGRIEVESEFGKGSLFRIHLPIRPPEAEESLPDAPGATVAPE